MIIVVLGCSGAGKTVLTNILKERFGCFCPVHTTTRKPRMGDNGFYKYIENDEFLKKLDNGSFFIASGDGKRYYGIESNEINEAILEGETVVINASIKDLKNLSVYENKIVIMLKYKHMIVNYFNSGVIKKVGLLEAIKRLIIYLFDRMKYRKDIKTFVNYVVYTNSIVGLL